MRRQMLPSEKHSARTEFHGAKAFLNQRGTADHHGTSFGIKGNCVRRAEIGAAGVSEGVQRGTVSG